MGAVRILLVLAVVLATLFVSGERKRVLGPRDPIALDGSLNAGRALTIAELKPPPEAPLSDLDNPGIFEERFSKSSVERYRDAILNFIELPGPAICEPDRRGQIVAAIQSYYGIKKYLNAEFHFRAPRASKFIDDAWTSPKDQQIEAFVGRLLERGYVRAREISPRDRSFLLDVLAQEFGTNACSRS
jgi:hypothetical protein